jgi:hypothetical protein
MPVCFDNSLRVRPSGFHQPMLDKQMVNKKLPFIVIGFLVKPQLVVSNIGEPEMLPEVGELFVEVAADIAAINDPDCEVSALFYQLDTRRCSA